MLYKQRHSIPHFVAKIFLTIGVVNEHDDES